MALKISKNLMNTVHKDKSVSFDKVKDYVKKHTSGEKHQYDLAESGSIIVSFEGFVQMIDEGYNIYYADVLNENVISIKYQKEIKREGRGR